MVKQSPSVLASIPAWRGRSAALPPPWRVGQIKTKREGAEMVGFTKEAIDLTIERWEAVQDYNACLERLVLRRKTKIAAEGPLLESKTGWKCAILQQALLYRVCALAIGVANEWNASNIICSVTLARALFETIVVAIHIQDELLRLRERINQDTAGAIDDLCDKHLFATRNQEIVDAGYGHLATNIITYVDKFDKKIPSVREAYDFLSEFAHPNGSGHLFTYGEINRETGHVAFHESAPRVGGIQGHVLSCFMLLKFFELVMDTFDETIPVVSEVDKGKGLGCRARLRVYDGNNLARATASAF